MTERGPRITLVIHMAKKKGKALTLRLDGLLEERVSDMARFKGVSRSELVRDALERTLKEDERLSKLTVYERLKPWIGIIDSSKHPDGPFTSDNASEQAGEIIRQKWEKRRAKRPR